MEERLGDRIDVTMLVLKSTDYRNSIELLLTLSFIHEFLVGLDVGTTVLVLTHCDQHMPDPEFVNAKLAWIEQSGVHIEREHVYFYEGSQSSIYNIKEVLKSSEGCFVKNEGNSQFVQQRVISTSEDSNMSAKLEAAYEAM